MWIDIEVTELQALVEAAEAGQKTGKLKRSPKRLEKALALIRQHIAFEQELIANVRARRAAGRL